MSRHAAPLSDYTAEEAADRLHAEMHADAMAHLAGLATSWPAPTGRPYDISIGTGSLPAILAAAVTRN